MKTRGLKMKYKTTTFKGYSYDARYRLVEDVVDEFCINCGRGTPKACEDCPILELMDNLESILIQITKEL